jgi:purine nucleosidase
MALMLALNSPELDVRAVTVVPGNVTAKQGLENALRMMSLANRCDIPVAAGAQHPLFQKADHGRVLARQEWVGEYRIAASKCQVDSRYGPDLIIEMVHAAPHEITLVPVGPLTNIALAVEKDPSIVPLVKEVISWAARSPEEIRPLPPKPTSTTIPKPRRSCFQAGWPLTMVGLDVGDKTLFSPKYLDNSGRRTGR